MPCMCSSCGPQLSLSACHPLCRVKPLHANVTADHITLRYKPAAGALEGLPLGAEYAVPVSGIISNDTLQVRLLAMAPCSSKASLAATLHAYCAWHSRDELWGAGGVTAAAGRPPAILCWADSAPHNLALGCCPREGSRCGVRHLSTVTHRPLPYAFRLSLGPPRTPFW